MQNVNLEVELVTIEKFNLDELVHELKNTFATNVFTKFNVTVATLAKKYAFENEKATLVDFKAFCVEQFFNVTKQKTKKDGSKEYYSLDSIAKDVEIAITDENRLNAKQLANAIHRLDASILDLFYKVELTDAQLKAKQLKAETAKTLKAQQEQKTKEAIEIFDILVSQNLDDIAKFLQSTLDESQCKDLAKLLNKKKTA